MHPQRAWGPALFQSTAEIAVGCDGTVVAAGDFRGSIDLGEGAVAAVGENDVFVVRLAQP